MNDHEELLEALKELAGEAYDTIVDLIHKDQWQDSHNILLVLQALTMNSATVVTEQHCKQLRGDHD